jgi:hypothetical protein
LQGPQTRGNPVLANGANGLSAYFAIPENGTAAWIATSLTRLASDEVEGKRTGFLFQSFER